MSYLDSAHLLLHCFIYQAAIVLKVLSTWKTLCKKIHILKAYRTTGLLRKERKFAEYIYAISNVFAGTSWKMARFLQHNKSMLDLLFDTHCSFCTTRKIVLIRPLEHCAHYLLTAFSFWSALVYCWPSSVFWMRVLVSLSLSLIFKDCHFKIVRKDRSAFYAGLLVLGEV